MVANGNFETPSATVELQLKLSDHLFHERVMFMNNLTSPVVGLPFLQRNNTILDMTQEVLNFLFFFSQLKHAVNTYSNINEPLLNLTKDLIQQSKQTKIHIISQVYTKKDITGIIQPSTVLEDNDALYSCPALTTTQNRKNAVLINTILEDP